jgi:hypothetical protein
VFERIFPRQDEGLFEVLLIEACFYYLGLDTHYFFEFAQFRAFIRHDVFSCSLDQQFLAYPYNALKINEILSLPRWLMVFLLHNNVNKLAFFFSSYLKLILPQTSCESIQD